MLLFFLELAVIAIAATLVACLIPFRMLEPEPAAEESTPSVELVEILIHTMRSDPSGWESDDFHLRHTSGISIWIANADYGIRLEKPVLMDFSKKQKRMIYEEIQRLAVVKAVDGCAACSSQLAT